MSIAIVRLGSARRTGEGLRIGTVRRPPRGVPKSEFASGNWYDVWFPNLSPSPALLKFAHAAKNEKEWERFKRRFRAEMKTRNAEHDLVLLAALSHETNLSLGCYCDEERHCHRSVLRQLLKEAGADIAA